MAMDAMISKIANITTCQKEAMLQLHRRCFCNVGRTRFFSDMEKKDWVILLKDAQNIVGFSTLQTLSLIVNEVPRMFIFSGDTLVHPAYWRNSRLAGSFGHFMLRQLAEQGDTPLYWFLVSKGFRTYRFLPVYFRRYFPVFNRVTPPEYQQLLDAVATHQYGKTYDARQGLVRATEQCDRLNPEMCQVSDFRQRDPHVRFFLDRNPGFHLGDELACLADVSKSNLNKYAWRVIKNTAVTWDE